MAKNYYTKDKIEAGCDEAGRGCLAGPVFAAAVILPKNIRCKELRDSKKLSLQKRKDLRDFIEKKALAWSVNLIDQKIIDEINILQASMKAMHLSLNKLKIRPELILVDGNYFVPYNKTAHLCIIKGDDKFKSIAAASILAKVYRDEYMQGLAKKFPEYGWDTNMGYPTKFHRSAISKLGLTSHHRKTFQIK